MPRLTVRNKLRSNLSVGWIRLLPGQQQSYDLTVDQVEKLASALATAVNNNAIDYTNSPNPEIPSNLSGAMISDISAIAGTTTFPPVQTVGYVASANERVRYNASGGTFILSAPVAPTLGSRWGIKEYVGDTTSITVSGNGTTIENPTTGAFAASFSVGEAALGVEYEFDGTSWTILSITHANLSPTTPIEVAESLAFPDAAQQTIVAGAPEVDVNDSVTQGFAVVNGVSYRSAVSAEMLFANQGPPGGVTVNLVRRFVPDAVGPTIDVQIDTATLPQLNPNGSLASDDTFSVAEPGTIHYLMKASALLNDMLIPARGATLQAALYIV